MCFYACEVTDSSTLSSFFCSVIPQITTTPTKCWMSQMCVCTYFSMHWVLPQGLKLALGVSLWFLLLPTPLVTVLFHDTTYSDSTQRAWWYASFTHTQALQSEASASIMSMLVGWQHSRTSSLVNSILLILNMAYKWYWWVGTRNQMCCLWWRPLSQSQRDKNPLYYMIDMQLI